MLIDPPPSYHPPPAQPCRLSLVIRSLMQAWQIGSIPGMVFICVQELLFFCVTLVTFQMSVRSSDVASDISEYVLLCNLSSGSNVGIYRHIPVQRCVGEW